MPVDETRLHKMSLPKNGPNSIIGWKQGYTFDDVIGRISSNQSFSRTDFFSIAAHFIFLQVRMLEGLSLETLSSQVLEFEGKARANPIGAPYRCFLLG
jgi:hypothetical protein